MPVVVATATEQPLPDPDTVVIPEKVVDAEAIEIPPELRALMLELPRGWLRTLLAPLRILTKDGHVVRLDRVWNYAQVAFVDEVERQIVEHGQVRIITLKARQIGISTIIEAILFTFAIMMDSFNSLVMAHEKDASQHLLSMSGRYWETYIHRHLLKEKYKGRAHLAWSDIDSQMIIKTAKNEESGRSNTIHALHASEVAFWPSPERLMTGLRQSIPSFGLTFIFMESTANGIGNYFHRECVRAMKGESEYAFMFFPWHKHPEYTASYIPAEQRGKYTRLDNLDEEELWLRDVMKVNDARLVWRRYAIANLCQGDVHRFHQEYPTTPHEAFISTGLNVFPLRESLNHYVPLRGQTGVLTRNTRGKVEFQPRSDGWLTVYRKPSADQSWGVYVCGGDPTHTLTGDNAVVQVLSRRTLEQVAVYRHKVDPIRFGKHMQLIGKWYNEALLAPEREGPGYATVGCIVGDGYENVYQATSVVSAQGKPADAYGWSTNAQTKQMMVSHLLKHITEPLSVVSGTTYGLVIHDELTLMEMRDYVTDDTGKKFTNSDGSEYDDGVTSLAIAVTVHDIEAPPPPYIAPSPHVSRPNVGSTMQAPPIPEPDPTDRDELDDDNDPKPPPTPPWEMWRTNHERT